MLGRPAKNATESDEGAVSLMLPGRRRGRGSGRGRDRRPLRRDALLRRGARGRSAQSPRSDQRGADHDHQAHVRHGDAVLRRDRRVRHAARARDGRAAPRARSLSDEPTNRAVRWWLRTTRTVQVLARFLREHPLARRAAHGALEPLVAGAVSRSERLRADGGFPRARPL